MQQIQEQSQQINEVMNADLIRTMYQMRILSQFQNMMLDYDHLPEKIAWSFQRLNDEIKSVEKLILDTAAGTLKGLESGIEKDKLMDIANVAELIGRIGAEEKDSVYEEFLTLLIGCINGVFYAETHRKRLHFGKYRALFQMVAAEIKADTNRELGQIYYRNGEIYFRSVAADIKHQIQ